MFCDHPHVYSPLHPHFNFILLESAFLHEKDSAMLPPCPLFQDKDTRIPFIFELREAEFSLGLLCISSCVKKCLAAQFLLPS